MATEGVWGFGFLLSPAAMLTGATKVREKRGKEATGSQEERPIPAHLWGTVVPEIQSLALGMVVSQRLKGLFM